MNLPTKLEISNTKVRGEINYTYSASGAKLRTVHKEDISMTKMPVVGTGGYTTPEWDITTTDYVGNKVYEQVNNGERVLKRILIDGGYYDAVKKKYFYYLTDHLGNNRVVAEANGTVVQKTHYYPFGMAFAESMGEKEQPYKYNGKELDRRLQLNTYDYSARYMDPAIGRFTSIDPLAEMYPSISPYAYCANNPVRFIDPTGMAYGDFLDESGRIIGNDGIDDNKLYVVKNESLSRSDRNSTKDFIRDNSGNTQAFSDNNIAYTNSIEIEGSQTARQAMVTEVKKDNGRGGTRDANNREYGGSIENGVVTVATPGEVGNPKTDATVSIELPTGKLTFHSHPSGTVVDGPPAGTLGGSTTTHYFEQTPSQIDVNNAGAHTNYVFGRSDNKVYIYNSNGTQASIPMNRFVTPRR